MALGHLLSSKSASFQGVTCFRLLPSSSKQGWLQPRGQVNIRYSRAWTGFSSEDQMDSGHVDVRLLCKEETLERRAWACQFTPARLRMAARSCQTAHFNGAWNQLLMSFSLLLVETILLCFFMLGLTRTSPAIPYRGWLCLVATVGYNLDPDFICLSWKPSSDLMSHVTLGKPLNFCNAQCGHLYDDGTDATGITGLEFYNQALNYH